ncbi:hypothetical protein TARUN_6204 [Trichoderma arundinaceum]|uniref:Uncharacterized protein n=1 Tax=Trichoderma arundinaceum TaxID=490622 RepID=A0A395NJN2_TRIAR|nr:hypothetical protein TARUN_6204 [Trichoderma arundinaceum]
MCPYPSASDLKSRMLRFPNCLKYVSGPSTILQQSAERLGNQWLWKSNNEVSDVCASEAPWWGCGMYSRAWTRLELASCDQDAENLPEIRPCNSDCLQFLLCLPFYGCFLGSQQNAVRSYYGIDGEDVQDYFDACCSPCITATRNEQEIILRQRARYGAPGQTDKQYLCYNPMAYPNTSVQHASVAREPAPRVQNIAAISDTKLHSLDDHVQPLQSTRRVLHSLEDDLATPGRATPQEHVLHNDPESATPVKPVPHGLGAMAPRVGPSKNELG